MWGSTVDETQQLKLRQIDSLKQYFSNVKEIQRETLFEIAVSLPNRKSMTLRLTLPRDFPKVPPSLQVFPPVQHRLVDSQMLIIPTAHENLSRWSVHASLGKTVYEIIQKFMQDPPLIANTVATPTPGTTSPYPYPTTSPSMVPTSLGGSTGPVKLPYESKPLPQTPDQKPQTHIPLPVVPATFPELESKTPNELSQLLSDDAEFQKFFEALPQVQTMKKLRDDLRDNNESLAKKNLEREQEIEALRAEVGTKVANITERRASFNQKAKRQQEILEQFSTPALIDKLTDAASNAEEESDNLARRFLNGDVEQKDFVKEFMEKRKLYHLRSAKKESLAMIVR